MAVIDNAYNYYMQTYGNSLNPNRYDTHKKSELRQVYNSMLKVNKESPLYKIEDPEAAQKFAIDLKESSRQIQNVISSMNEDYSTDGAFKKKIAYSSDESAVTVDYIGNGSEQNNIDGFSIDVDALAKPQINTGAFLDNDRLSLATGDYAFDVTVNRTAYTFEFSVRAGDTNESINTRLANLINKANIGLDAEVIENDRRQNALQITSTQTGLSEGQQALFTITPEPTEASGNMMNALQINHMTQAAQNSSFKLNGQEHSSYSNNFTINRAFELNLNKVTSGSGVQIGFKSDAEAIADNVTHLTDAFNSLVEVANKYHGDNADMNKLGNMVHGIAERYADDLEPLGLTFTEGGTISVDKAALTKASDERSWGGTNEVLSRFKQSVSNLTDRASLNPIDFVEKKICAYKNPGHNFTAPYATSTYAGMIFNKGR